MINDFHTFFSNIDTKFKKTTTSQDALDMLLLQVCSYLQTKSTVSVKRRKHSATWAQNLAWRSYMYSSCLY